MHWQPPGRQDAAKLGHRASCCHERLTATVAMNVTIIVASALVESEFTQGFALLIHYAVEALRVVGWLGGGACCCT